MRTIKKNNMEEPSKTTNRLLARLSPQDSKLFADLQLVPMTLRQTLFEDGAPLEYVYFIEAGVASVLMTMATGGVIEVGMVGSEGMVNVAAVLGAKVSAQHIIVQVEGSAYRMRADYCRQAFDKSPSFRNNLLRFIGVSLTLSAQTAACNRLHRIEQRCARWLLMASARAGAETFSMTHEFLASMLGARRSGVTETAGKLQKEKLIRYHHGKLTILNHKGLEKAACECYRLDRDRFDVLEERG